MIEIDLSPIAPIAGVGLIAVAVVIFGPVVYYFVKEKISNRTKNQWR